MADTAAAAELTGSPARWRGMETALKRTAEMAAMFMIGDGLLGIVQPRRHVALWRSDIPAADLVVRPFAERPGRRRLYGAVQLAIGLALARRLRPRQTA